MTKKALVSRLLGKFFETPAIASRNYSLHSGERQTAITLNDIRADHRYRYEKAIEMIKSRLPVSRQLLGIDVFCANGYGSYMLSTALECFMLGVDASEEAISQANRHFSTDRTFFCCKEFPFQLPHATCDFATCIESVEHVHEYRLLMRELANSLREGGLLFVSTPNEEVMPFDPVEMPFHVKHFTEDELVGLVTEQHRLRLLTTFGQDVYAYENELKKGVLPGPDMQLHEGRQAQFQLYVCEKI